MEINKRLSKILIQYFKDNINLLFIADRNVIIVTKADRVYQFDEWVNKTYARIAYTIDISVVKTLIEESIVEELCDKKVIDIKSGFRHTTARTSDGKVYVWGLCKGGIIGNGYEDRELYKPKLNEYLKDLNIIDMSCGFDHSLVLTSRGDIYGWGLRRVAEKGEENEWQSIPIKMNELIDEKFKAISCGALHSLALTESGRVFGCGTNSFGQSCYSCLEGFEQLTHIDMNGVIVGKISCGLRHSLLLSNEGNIYALGNHYSTKLEEKFSEPLKLNHSIKIDKIATHWSQQFSAALSETGSAYVWGEFNPNGQNKVDLKETLHNSFTEIFIKYLQITYQPIEGFIIEFDDRFIRNKHYERYYREIEKLGAGSYGVVFKVIPIELKTTFYAIKKIELKNANEKEILKELEIYGLISKIHHKNIVRFNKFWTERNTMKKSLTLHIEMELCEQTLDEFILILQDLKLVKNDSLSHLIYYISSTLFIEILEGVNYLHKQNPPIIHRDLCPDNILLKLEYNDEVVVKIADFGLATIHKYAKQLHEPDIGHVRYIAPEVEDDGNYDTRADVYSLGKIASDLFGIYPDERFDFVFLLQSFIL
jgi:alpha-tubulin suppressor-like RCC1 family protein